MDDSELRLSFREVDDAFIASFKSLPQARNPLSLVGG